MAGSLVWRSYTSDAGVASSLFRDESNCEATVGGATLLQPFAAGNPGLNSLVRPRYVNTQLSTDPNRRKRFLIGTVAIFNTILAGAQVTEGGGTTALIWNVTSKRGEQSRIPTATDTSQTDGDPT